MTFVATGTLPFTMMAEEADHRLIEQEFLATFSRSKGARELFVITSLLSLGIGVTIALTPAVSADRYARLFHDYNGPFCYSYSQDKPQACQNGANDAQDASTWSNLVLCVMLLLCSPVIGTLSDARGRRPLLLASLILAVLPAFAFCMLVHTPSMSPFWYFAANSVAGSISTLSLVFAALSDVIPTHFRGPAFGVLMAGYYGGFAIGPTLALNFNETLNASILSFGILVVALLLGMLFLPETLTDDQLRQVQQEDSTSIQILETGNDSEEIVPSLPAASCTWLWRTATQPIRNVAILNRNHMLRLLTVASFFSAMVFATDSTLVLYYIENQLNIQENDLAPMFLVLGVFGILCQAGLLQPLIRVLGEKPLLVATFACGVCHNLAYGIANTKYGITLAFIMSQLTKLNFPLLSSAASRGASADEQGQVQGALFATNAIANALGPLILEYVYRQTQHTRLGPGFMWICAAILYLVGTIIVMFIPMDHVTLQTFSDNNEYDMSTSVDNGVDGRGEESNGLDEPLLDYG
ncbi:hypothetical protein MPSEU_000877600 [Mayamaea pseudoterrestris]|nr:hypothetical protein MPSEU_000877600 [Mayamaea pseudoterrestris]